MTLMVSPWVVWGVLSLALFGVVFLWRVARGLARDALERWRDRRESGTDEDEEPGEPELLHEWHDHPPLGYHDEAVPGCPSCERRWELPPERSAEALGFTGKNLGLVATMRSPTFLERLEARRERLASAAELEHRAAYEALGFDYPSGLMAAVREAAP